MGGWQGMALHAQLCAVQVLELAQQTIVVGAVVVFAA
jgi:hypothetical protein